MQKIIIVVVCFFIAINVSAQQFPAITIADIYGKTFNTSAFEKEGDKPVVLAFWATWCGPCVNELSIINDKLLEWEKLANFKFYAVSTDDSRTNKKVLPMVKGKGWQFDVLIDKNQDLKRTLNVMNIPYTLIIEKGEIIYKHAGFVPGDEDEILKILTRKK